MTRPLKLMPFLFCVNPKRIYRMEIVDQGRLLIAIAVSGGVLAVTLLVARALDKQTWFSIWIKRPFQVFSFAFTLWIFSRISHLSGIDPYATAIGITAVAGGIIHVIISFSITVFFSRERSVQLPPLLMNVILFGIYIVIFVATLKIFMPDFSLTPFVLASGVLSFVVGLAFQDVLVNFISGVTLSVEKPLRINDWIMIDDLEGKVVGITWRTTKIRTRENDFIVFPNRRLAEREVRNFNYPTPLHRCSIVVGLPYSTLPTIAQEAMLEAAKRVEGVLSRPRPNVILVNFDDSAITYELRVWIDDFDDAQEIESDVRKELFYALARYGISIPFPIRTVHFFRGEHSPNEWKEPFYHRLHVISGSRKGKIFPLEEKTVLIGRGSECYVDLRDPATSKEHARVSWEDGDYYLEDARSKHGTFVNGGKVVRKKLRTGDEIKIGESILRFERIVFD